MEWKFALLAGVLTSVGIYMLLGRHMLSLVFGLSLLGSAANLVVFAGGRVRDGAAPLIPIGFSAPPEAIANPLPQALVLTAIVIGFGIAAFALALSVAAYHRLGTADPETMTDAEGQTP
ncbi:MAG: NADH-quinone oxidoreductase subunit K [Pseudomonadota bacterium]